MREGALTSLALCDLYRANTAHERYLTSEIRSNILSYNITVLV